MRQMCRGIRSNIIFLCTSLIRLFYFFFVFFHHQLFNIKLSHERWSVGWSVGRIGPAGQLPTVAR